MRFSHFLKYNAVPEWQSHYMDYSALKNLIYTLQTDELKQDEPVTQVKEIVDFVGGSSDNLPTEGNSSTTMNLTAMLKSKLFGKFSSNEKAEPPLDETDFKEETVELEDMSPVKNHGSTSLMRIKAKLFDSRRSSSSSSDKSLLSPHDTFMDRLTEEKFKVDDFYKRLESKFYKRFETLLEDLEKEGVVTRMVEPYSSNDTTDEREQTEIITINDNNEPFDVESVLPKTIKSMYDISEDERGDGDGEEDDDEVRSFVNTTDNTALLNYAQFNIETQKKSLLKQSVANLYIDLCQLKSFIELNKIGFSKITKKSDKVLHFNTRQTLIESGEFFKDTYLFQPETLTALNSKISQLIEFYAVITGNLGDLEEAKRYLKSFLHDHIVWERSNVWKDMLGLSSRNYELDSELDDSKDKEQYMREKLKIPSFKYRLSKPIGFKSKRIHNLAFPKFFVHKRAIKIYIIFTITAILLGVPTFTDPAQHRCMALLIFLALFWATEAIPLHITGLFVPLLVVLFKVMKDSDGNVMNATDTSSKILSTMWSSTIMILLAGFTIGEALSQYNIAKVLASWILSAAGTKPRNVILVAMCVVFFLSMWISNVASPVLTYSLLAPMINTLDASNPFAKALILGIALSADIGGMSSPISSPQNIISMGYLDDYGIGWGQFFAVALPTGICAMLCSWLLMIFSFKIHTTKLEKFEPIRTKFTLKQYYIIAVTIITIILWCLESKLVNVFGESGEIAVIPIVLFFGTGLLSTSDFNTFPWSIVILAMGGLALGAAVTSSGLLVTIATALQHGIEDKSVFAILCIFGILMLLVGTFISHTVSAVIVIPLVQEVGNSLSDPRAAPILIFGCALISSCGMGLPSSGFPNVTAIGMLDQKGDRYLNVGSFISRGVPASFLAYFCVVTLGFGIMHAVVHS